MYFQSLTQLNSLVAIKQRHISHVLMSVIDVLDNLHKYHHKDKDRAVYSQG
jgi:hypothetical protein